MQTGLETFDRFGWESLLAGREVLVVAGVRSQAMALASSLEEAGAKTTIAPDCHAALEKAAKRPFAATVICWPCGAVEELSRVAGMAGRLLVQADMTQQALLRAAVPEAEFMEFSANSRALVLRLAGADSL